MAKNNPGDILTCDWNPVIGCERYSAGCAVLVSGRDLSLAAAAREYSRRN